MTGIDWIFAAVFVVSVLVGIFRGFVKEVLSILSWIVAIWLAINFSAPAGEWIAQYINIPHQKFREWAGFAAIFIVTLFIFALITYVITKLVVRGPIKGLDRVLGMGTGAVRALAIMVVLLIVARGFNMQTQNWWLQSQFIPHLLPVVDFTERMLPEEWQGDAIKDGATELPKQVIQGQINKSINEPTTIVEEPVVEDPVENTQ